MGPSDLRIRVRAAGLNRADVLQMAGLYPPPAGAPADVLGLEYAGEVVEVGPWVTEFAPGSRVMGLVAGGAFAEEVTVHAREALAIPDGVSFEDAAAIPEAFITAFDALTLQGDMRPNEWVLVHAVASGVGTAALQWITACGATAVGTSRSQEKLDRCRQQLGLAHGVVVGEPARFADAVRALTAQRGVNVALELVGGKYLPETAIAMAPRGRILLVGLLGGGSADLPLGPVLSRRLRLTGTVLRSRPLEEKITVAQRFSAEVLPMFARGLLRPVVDSVFPMAAWEQAVARMRSNQTFGKCVLTWDGETL